MDQLIKHNESFNIRRFYTDDTGDTLFVEIEISGQQNHGTDTTTVSIPFHVDDNPVLHHFVVGVMALIRQEIDDRYRERPES